MRPRTSPTLLFSRFLGTSAGSAARPASPLPPRQPLMESLEGRCLLSATTSDGSAPEAALTSAAALGASSNSATAAASTLRSTYSGSIKFARSGAQVRPNTTGDFAAVINSADAATGVVTGSMTSPRLGSVDFTGQLVGKKVTLSFTGDATGTGVIQIKRSGLQIQGRVTDAVTREKATFKASQNASARALTAEDGTFIGLDDGSGTGGATIATDGSNNPGNTTFTSEFVGTYSANVDFERFRFADEESQGGTANGGGNLLMTLTFTSETADDLLTGTMTLGSLGTYNVTGVVKGAEMTLITTGAGTGVFHLKHSNNGDRLTGRYAEESNGVQGRANNVRLNKTSDNANGGGTGTGGTGGTGTGGTGTGGTGTGTDGSGTGGTGTGGTGTGGTGTGTGGTGTGGTGTGTDGTGTGGTGTGGTGTGTDGTGAGGTGTGTDGTGTGGTGTGGTGTGGTGTGGTGTGTDGTGTGTGGTGTDGTGTGGTGTGGTGTGTGGTGTGTDGTGTGTGGTGTGGTDGTGTGIDTGTGGTGTGIDTGTGGTGTGTGTDGTGTGTGGTDGVTGNTPGAGGIGNTDGGSIDGTPGAGGIGNPSAGNGTTGGTTTTDGVFGDTVIRDGTFTL